jgi:hypothetical protein
MHCTALHCTALPAVCRGTAVPYGVRAAAHPVQYLVSGRRTRYTIHLQCAQSKLSTNEGVSFIGGRGAGDGPICVKSHVASPTCKLATRCDIFRPGEPPRPDVTTPQTFWLVLIVIHHKWTTNLIWSSNTPQIHYRSIAPVKLRLA